MTFGFLITRPSLTNLRIFCRELAKLISEDSLGSNQIFLLPHFKMEAANLFCNFSETMFDCICSLSLLSSVNG